MKHDASRFMRAILSVLENEIAPFVTEDYPRHRLNDVVMVLARMIANAEADDEQIYLNELVSEFAGVDASKLPGTLRQTIATAEAARNGRKGSLDQVKGEFAAGLAAAFAPAAAEAQVLKPLVNAIASAEHLVREKIEADIVALRKQLSQVRTSTTELDISEATLTDYLRKKMPDSPNIRAAAVKPVPGGRSKATILLDMVDGDEVKHVVIRKDFTKNFMGCSVTDEYPIIRGAWESGVLVPKPLWLEEDPGIIDGKFIVFERVAGRVSGTMFEINASPALVRHYAREIAKLHAVDIDRSGIAKVLQYAQSDFPVKEMVLESYEKHRRATPDDLLLESAHIWMLNNIGTVEHGAYLVHGDAGFHNVLGEGDKMTALLDWELAHAGDPAEDLMKCKMAASQVIRWEEFMEIYVASGGKPLSPERERFFTIWRLVSFSMYAADALKMFQHEDNDIRLAAVGFNTFSRLHDHLARELANAPR